jgi:hypothetical protein
MTGPRPSAGALAELRAIDFLIDLVPGVPEARADVIGRIGGLVLQALVAVRATDRFLRLVLCLPSGSLDVVHGWIPPSHPRVAGRYRRYGRAAFVPSCADSGSISALLH